MFSRVWKRLGWVVVVAPLLCSQASEVTDQVRVARFDVDATPPPGNWMAYDEVANTWPLGLRARGMVLLGADKPIVLCSIDWLGLANEGYEAFRREIAAAAGTSPERVAVHAVHQHDAPDCDFSAERILKEAEEDPRQFEGTFQRQVLKRLSEAVRNSITSAQNVTHVGLGQATIEKVASNRRILGPEGKVTAVRYTTCTDPALREAPEGTIDPVLSMVSFWNQEKPVAILTYFATHPQSYYRTGLPNPDFPGVARFFRELAVPEALHVHFNGAGGNIGAGKYNDGAHVNRLLLAERVARGMSNAWVHTAKEEIRSGQVGWKVEPVRLPLAAHLKREELEASIKTNRPGLRQADASRLAWLERTEKGQPIDLTCLVLGSARVLHMPGELFVEYQLAAKAYRPDLFVAMAAYGEYAPWYIGTAVAYTEGGYETAPRSSNVAPESEAVLMKAMQRLLQD